MGNVAKTVGDSLFGSSPSMVGSASAYSPNQQQLIDAYTNYVYNNMGNLDISENPLYQQGSSALSGIINATPDMLEERYRTQFVEPQMNQFQREIVPMIEQRFADVGGARSGGLNQVMAAAAEELATRLASQRAALMNEQETRRQQAIDQAFKYSAAPSEIELRAGQVGLQPSQIPIVDPGQQGILGQILGVIAGMAMRGAI